ncbi:pyridoxamine 5'-phosphate oxidase family protein [Geomonas sp. RF6]|uniref:pyridoxamine 5'-phosphate oxidase family protein n=1 Tax=Geomonas sp. RF6 TaxID=2897342 RepID=UPI001E53AA07|nr:pyridoxamine 5'-phosphate oxidase family protein [Geomonas sp. RF6]UFS69526.1 pyridoxamine 5'-phosphate oxidase family protein [Geomonas sp. RF6]
MITEKVKSFIQKHDYALVASADERGVPHLAAGRDLMVPDPEHIVFRAWFCNVTLHNLEKNAQVTLAVVDPVSGEGFQLAGRMEGVTATAFADGLAPGEEPPGTPQVESSLTVLVQRVMAFTAGAHTDQPIE